jgi:O-antigen/teichoic acid export membrane protein
MTAHQASSGAGNPGPLPAIPSLTQTLKGAACLSLQPLALNVLSVPVMAYIIRCLGADGYAQWMTAVSLLAVCAVITNPGLRGAFVRHVAAEPASAQSALAEQLGLRLMLTAVAGAMIACLCVALGYPGPVAWCIAVGVGGLALTTVATTFADLLQSLHRVRTLAAVNMAAGLTLTGTSAVVAACGAGPVAIALAYLTGPAVSAASLLFIVRRQVCPVGVRVNLRRCKALLARSRFFAAQQLLSVGSAQAEAVMLPLMVRMSHFGQFSAGAMIPNRLAALPDGLCTAAYPGLVKTCARGPQRAAWQVLVYVAIAAVGGVGVALTGMLAAGPIGRLLFPADSALFAGIVRITIWALPLVGVEMVLGYALNAAGRDACVARASLPGAALSLLASVMLVSSLGVAGACWSMLLRPALRGAFLVPIAFRTFRPGAAEARSTAGTIWPQAAAPLKQAG